MKFGKSFLLVLLALHGCSGIPLDPSPRAVASGDFTLVNACASVPSGGLSACRVKEGAPVSSVWRIIVPHGGELSGGELAVRYRDVTHTYPISESVIEVPWSDFLGKGSVWKSEDAAAVVASAIIRWKDPQGIEQVWQARGVALIMVLAKSYDEMPLNSGFVAWEAECKEHIVQYSTSGRSALRCK